MSSIANSSLRDELRVSSFSMLPTEIISEIFVSCLPSYWQRCSTLDPTRAPMLLLRVCGQWRSIALSTPRLWAKINLEFASFAQPFFDEGNLEKFLEESKVDGRLIPTILKQHATRVEELQLIMDLDQYPKHTPSFLQLQKLELRFPVEYDDEDPKVVALKGNPIQIFATASQLRQLHLDCVPPSLFAIRWENLEEFIAFGISSRDFVDALRWSPSLVHCTLDSPYLDSDTAVISHPNLKSFKFSQYMMDETIFRFLAFPALENLNLYTESVDDVDLLQFISRSSSSLLRLTSRLAVVPLESLSDMIALTSLTLFAPSSEYLVEFFHLFDRTKHPTFLPQLEELALKNCPPFVNPLLGDALSSRCTATQDREAILRSFCQVWPNDLLVDSAYDHVDLEGRVPAAFDELMESGMHIYIGPYAT
ncbi:F-box domain-containing protein [Mycena sanguinolenta]|uniref:F-box domain-containing protein n=1 Tax=Mycena sanguinolenta TaxID=230812 RepID=A0A8H6X672_9AGAR|nr:F-box domain-containing protein [Mycena sanguinolenta]